MIDFREVSGELAIEAGFLLVETYKDTLIENRKFATKKTHDSIKYRIEVSATRLKVQITANQSLMFIESGRRKGAKLPVQKVGEKFELVPELKEWVEAVNFTGAHYLLAKGISERGIQGIPITGVVREKVKQRITELITDFYGRSIQLQAVQSARKIFR